MLHNHWLQNLGTQQFSNAASSPQVHPPVTNPEVPLHPPKLLQSTPLQTSPKANKSYTLLH